MSISRKVQRTASKQSNFSGTVTGRSSSSQPNVQNFTRPAFETLYAWLVNERIRQQATFARTLPTPGDPVVRVLLRALRDQRGWTALARLEFKHWLKDDALAKDAAVEALIRMAEAPTYVPDLNLINLSAPVLAYLRANYHVPLTQSEAQYLLEMES